MEKENFKKIAEEIGDRMIKYKKCDKTMKELFNYYLFKYDDEIKVEHIEILRLTVSYISKKGYEIISTHPFKIKSYK